MVALVVCLWWTASAQVFRIGRIGCLSVRSGGAFSFFCVLGMVVFLLMTISSRASVSRFRVIYGTAFVCLLISGAALVYQVVWMRYLALFIGHTSGAVVAVSVVGLGSGVTCGAVLRHDSVKRLDVVEISPAVLRPLDFFNTPTTTR